MFMTVAVILALALAVAVAVAVAEAKVPAIRPLIEVSAPYAKLSKRLREIVEARRQTEERLTEVNRLLSAAASAKPDLLDLDADLSGTITDAADLAALSIEKQALQRERESLVTAHRDGEERLARIAREVAPEAAKELVAHHRRIVERMGKALLELRDMRQAEDDVLHALRLADLPTSAIAPHGPTWPNRPDAEDVRAWVKARLDDGTLPRTEPWLSAAAVR